MVTGKEDTEDDTDSSLDSEEDVQFYQDMTLPPPVERFLPIANTVRAMRHTLPEYAKISQSSKELVTECASEFISFITSEYVRMSKLTV
jgi:histone H3/H4